MKRNKSEDLRRSARTVSPHAVWVRSRWAPVFFLLILIGGCGDVDLDYVIAFNASLNEEFDLGSGKEAHIPGEGLVIILRNVSEDSRCPTGVSCSWEGNAKIFLEIAKTGRDAATIELNTSYTGGPQEASYLEYSVKLLSLSPAPRHDHGIDPDDYLAGLLVTKD